MRISPKIICLFLIFYNPVFGNDIVVTTASDQFNTPSGGQISLREALRDAEDSASRVTFDPSLSNAVITLNPVLGSLRITDPDPATDPSFTGLLTIDASDLLLPPRISAPEIEESDQAVIVISGRPVRIRNMVVENSGHGGIRVEGNGINLTLEETDIRYCNHYGLRFSGGTLSMNECEVYGNIVHNLNRVEEAPAVWFDKGFVLNMTACSVYHNSGRGVFADVDFAFGRSAALTNVTIAENSTFSADSTGGGLYVDGPLATQVKYCTIVDNSGGGVYSDNSSTRLYASIIARNRSREDGSLSNITGSANSNGYNISDSSPAGLDESTDMLATDPGITRIGLYGGHAPVCYPLVGSAALNAGDSFAARTAAENIDGRGYVREIDTVNSSPDKNFIDVGAVEVNFSPNRSYLVPVTVQAQAGSLQKQLALTTGLPERVIYIHKSLDGAVFPVEDPLIIQANENIVVDASSLAEPIILRADGSGISLQPGSSLTLHNVILDNSLSIQVPGDSQLGLSCAKITGMSNESIRLSARSRFLANQCEFEDPAESGFTNSGLRSLDSSQVQIWNSTFTNIKPTGTSLQGGAIRSTSDRPLELHNVTFQGNSTPQDGAAVHQENGLLVARYCSVFENASNFGAFAFGTDAGSRVHGCLFSGNTNKGGGVLDADTIIPPGSEANHFFLRNWTTNSPNRPDGFEPGDANIIGADVTLLEFGDYGGKIRVRPHADDSGLIGEGTGIPRLALDALGRIPLEGSLTPGAVTGTSLSVTFAIIEEIRIVGATVEITVVRTPGSSWNIEAGMNLDDLEPTAVNIPAGTAVPAVVTIPLPSPVPDRYFLRLSRD